MPGSKANLQKTRFLNIKFYINVTKSMLCPQVLTSISQISPTSQSVPIRPQSVIYPKLLFCSPNPLTGPPSFTSTLLLSPPSNHRTTFPVPSAKPHQHSWRPTSSRKYSSINPTYSPTIYINRKSLLDKHNEQKLYLLFISPVLSKQLIKALQTLCVFAALLVTPFSQDNETFPSIPRVRHTSRTCIS